MNRGYGGGASVGIRHAYPLAVTSASFTSAFILNLRTLPYAFIRFFLHVVHAVVAVLFFVALAVCSAELGKFVHPVAGVGVFIAGSVIYGIVWAWWLRYLLYAVKCGHIACLTDLVTRGQVGNGNESMLTYGRHVVSDRFPDVVQVFALQALIRGVVHEFNWSIGFVGDFLPFNLGILLMFGRRLLTASTRFLDETLFSYSLIRRSEPLWDVCSEGLGYYFQNSKEILKTSIWMMFLNPALRFLIMWTIGIATAWFSFHLFDGIAHAHANEILNAVSPGGTDNGELTLAILSGMAAIVFALVFALFSLHTIEQAFLHPVYLTMVISKFLIVIQSQPLDPSFERFLGTTRAQALRTFATQPRTR
jgi:hypothetical protein